MRACVRASDECAVCMRLLGLTWGMSYVSPVPGLMTSTRGTRPYSVQTEPTRLRRPPPVLPPVLPPVPRSLVPPANSSTCRCHADDNWSANRGSERGCSDWVALSQRQGLLMRNAQWCPYENVEFVRAWVIFQILIRFIILPFSPILLHEPELCFLKDGH